MGPSLWRIAEDNITCLHRFSDEELIRACKFSSDGTRLVMESRNVASLWKIAEDNITCLHRFSDEELIRVCEFSPDGTCLVMVSHSGAKSLENS